jgi:hypothetical protein
VTDETADKAEMFFVTGLEKYLDAKAAVTMFEQEVQRRVKKVVTRRQPELAELFGKGRSLKGYYEASGMPDFMYLGAQVAFKGSGALYFSLAFERNNKDGSGPSPSVIFWRERTSLMEPLWKAAEKIKQGNENLGVLNDRFWLAGSQPSANWDSCEKALDSVITAWIELWTKLGGLPKYLVAQGPPMKASRDQ